MPTKQLIAIMAAILRTHPLNDSPESAVREARLILAEVEKQRADTGRRL